MLVSSEIATLDVILCNRPSSSGQTMKVRAEGLVRLYANGIETEAGDKERYDDPDCALMHYAREHYDFWRKYYASQAELFDAPGIFGENFSTLGMAERTVCIGDVISIGSAKLQVSWGREACSTMASRLHDETAPKRMHDLSKNGWFYRVLEEGKVREGMPIFLLERPNPQWSVDRVQQALFNPQGERQILEMLVELPYLSNNWREKFAALLSQ